MANFFKRDRGLWLACTRRSIESSHLLLACLALGWCRSEARAVKKHANNKIRVHFIGIIIIIIIIILKYY